MRILLAAAVILVSLLIACAMQDRPLEEESAEVKTGLKLNSMAFKEGERIPDKHTCNEYDVSPPLSWGKAETGVKSWTLIVDDPDASRTAFTHWTIYNIPAGETGLPEAIPTSPRLPNGALQGQNDTLKSGYSGPCPPPGLTHHYNFTLYALYTLLDLPAGASKKQLIDAMKGHIISQGKLTGLYSR
jgi:Raf kinase inhibitor-like YbhB/YbcL family protein